MLAVANIEFTKDDADRLIELINIAVKVNGLGGATAEQGVYFFKKINSAFQPKRMNPIMELNPEALTTGDLLKKDEVA